jgi:hypothetical protein
MVRHGRVQMPCPSVICWTAKSLHFGDPMRASSLLPIALAAAAATGCSSNPSTTASHSVPVRNLSVPSHALHRPKFASPLELGQVRHHSTHLPRKSKLISLAAAPTIIPVTFRPAPGSSSAPQPAPEPVRAAEPVNEHELPPGQTVTLIPASSGPSVAPDLPDQPAPKARRHSGRAGKGGGRGSCHSR